MSKRLEKKEKLIELSLVSCNTKDSPSTYDDLAELSQQLGGDLRQIGRHIRDLLASGKEVWLTAKAARPGFSDTRSLERAANPGSVINLKMYTFRPNMAEDLIRLVSNGMTLPLDSDPQSQSTSRKQPKPHARLVLVGWIADNTNQQRVDLVLHPKSATAHIGKVY